MEVQSEIIYTLSVTGSCKINNKLWEYIPVDNIDTYIFNQIEDSIYGNNKNKFKGYKLKDNFQNQLHAKFKIKYKEELKEYSFNIKDILVEFKEKLELLLLKITYDEYEALTNPDIDCIDYLTIITAAKLYEDTTDFKQSIELEIENESYTLLYGENNYNGLSEFIFETPVKFENMGDNCAFSINCFSGVFFKDRKKC